MNEDLFNLGVKALIRNEKGELLVLKVNIALLTNIIGWHGEEYWDIPGGRIRKGDTVEDTLKREVLEETGVTISLIKPVQMLLSNIRIPSNGGDIGLILSTYSCEIDNNQKISLSEENTEFRWVQPKVAAELLKFKYPKDFCDRISEL